MPRLKPVDVLAAARLVRLVRRDSITRGAREALIREAYVYRGVHDPIGGSWSTRADLDENPPLVAELLGCSWCLGVWCAALVFAARRVAPRLWDPIAEVLAASFLASVAEIAADRA